MTANDDRIEYAVWRTEIIRLPKQKLATFGTTNIHYYLLTEPAYAELTREVNETVVREGRVIAERPKIVTPYYLSHLEGFSHEARRYLDALIKTYGSDAPGLFYTYPRSLTSSRSTGVPWSADLMLRLISMVTLWRQS
jgi:hypothetical protein